MRMPVILTAALLAAPAYAQDGRPGDIGPAEDGQSLIERGAQLLFRQLAEDMAPEIRRLMQDLGQTVDGLPGYHPPEILPNGDIIIRRRAPADPFEGPDGETEI